MHGCTIASQQLLLIVLILVTWLTEMTHGRWPFSEFLCWTGFLRLLCHSCLHRRPDHNCQSALICLSNSSFVPSFLGSFLSGQLFSLPVREWSLRGGAHRLPNYLRVMRPLAMSGKWITAHTAGSLSGVPLIWLMQWCWFRETTQLAN